MAYPQSVRPWGWFLPGRLSFALLSFARLMMPRPPLIAAGY